MKAKEQYYRNRVNGDEQAVVLYDDGSTVVWDIDGSKGTNSGGDNFDYYCQNLEHSGFDKITNPTWSAPDKP